MNRLTKVYKTPATPVLIAEYAYDALNRRVRKIVTNGGLSNSPAINGTTVYHYSGNQCVEERNGSNAATKQYVWGIYIDELIQQRVDIDTTAKDQYVLSDLLYRAIALTDDLGAIIEAYDYDAYGNTLIFNAAGTGGDWWADDATQTLIPTCDYLFTGRRYDPETEIYFYRARYYNQVLGRFISRDPIVYAGGINLYGYVGGSPLNRLDPSGKYILINARSSTYYKRKWYGDLNSHKRNNSYKITEGGNKVKLKDACPKCALVWVHGFQNTLASAKTGFKDVEKAYKKAGGKSKIYGFAWNSNPGNPNFAEAKQAADQLATGAFNSFIKDLRAACPDTRISLGGHSLGARIILEALQNGQAVQKIHNTILVAAAVDNETLEPGEECPSGERVISVFMLAVTA